MRGSSKDDWLPITNHKPATQMKNNKHLITANKLKTSLVKSRNEISPFSLTLERRRCTTAGIFIIRKLEETTKITQDILKTCLR